MGKRGEFSRDDLVKVVKYDPVTGYFYRILTGRRRTADAKRMATRLDTYGYLTVGFQRRNYPAHRLAWFYVHGEWPSHEIDHINGIRHDNRLCNLREGTRTQQRANSRRPSNNSTGMKGVYRWKGRWKAQIQVNKKSHFLGCFDTPEQAHAAYLLAANMHFGEFGFGGERGND